MIVNNLFYFFRISLKGWYQSKYLILDCFSIFDCSDKDLSFEDLLKFLLLIMELFILSVLDIMLNSDTELKELKLL